MNGLKRKNLSPSALQTKINCCRFKIHTGESELDKSVDLSLCMRPCPSTVTNGFVFRYTLRAKQTNDPVSKTFYIISYIRSFI